VLHVHNKRWRRVIECRRFGRTTTRNFVRLVVLIDSMTTPPATEYLYTRFCSPEQPWRSELGPCSWRTRITFSGTDALAKRGREKNRAENLWRWCMRSESASSTASSTVQRAARGRGAGRARGANRTVAVASTRKKINALVSPLHRENQAVSEEMSDNV
jgi:hypothetical protein